MRFFPAGLACLASAVGVMFMLDLAATSPGVFKHGRKTNPVLAPESRVTDRAIASRVYGKIPIRVVRPATSEAGPVIIFQHQLGDGIRQFEREARELASRCKIASVLVAAPFARPRPWKRTLDWRVNGRDADIQRQAIADLRTVADEVPALGITATAYGYVGHSYGANWGGILSSTDRRYGAFVLIAGLGSVTRTMRASDPEWSTIAKELGAKKFADYRASLLPLDPEQYVARAPPGTLLFQFGERDQYVSVQSAREFVAKAGSSHTVKWYKTDHEFRSQTAEADRRVFLANKLGAHCQR